MQAALGGFLFKVVVISASGALSPGPLTVAVLTIGIKGGWRSGFLASVGHTLAELPLVLCLALGLSSVLTDPKVKLLTGALGGSALITFGALQFVSSLKEEGGAIKREAAGSSTLIGFTLTLFNPFFILWWVSVGLPLIYDALSLMGFKGVAVLYASHVWLDYAWLTSVAHVASMGRRSVRVGRYASLILSLALIPLGANMIYASLLH